mgnify:CR=1 FL=1
MLLVVDVGNTNIVMGVYEGERLIQHWRLETRKSKTSDEYGMLIRQLCELKGIDPDGIQNIILSCVVPPLVKPMVKMGQTLLGCSNVMVVGEGTRTGMPIRSDNPREVGADRIVNSVAAYELCSRASGMIVCDFGTATTFDVVSPQGEYLGGAIAPGVGISLDALFHQASKLPRIELVRPPKVVGRNTVASMQAGIYFGYIGLVDGIVTRMMAELDFEPRVIATGGIAELVAQDSNTIDEVLPFLTLDGLRILYDRNQPAD